MPKDRIAAMEDTQAAAADAKTASGNRRRSLQRQVQSITPAAFEDTGVPEISARETRTSAKFGFENKGAGSVALPPAPPRTNTAAKVVMVGLPLLALAGVATWHFVLRDQGTTEVAPAPVPAPTPAVAVPAPPVVKEPTKIEVQLDADAPSSRVVFRRRVSPTPMKTELTPSDIVELVEVSAPGYKTERYWLTFDRATHLKAHMAKGSGIEEATEEQTLIALGEAEAPAEPPPVVAVAPTPAPQAVKPKPATVVAAAPQAPRRKIGKGAAEEPASPAAVEPAKLEEVAVTPPPAPEPVPAPTPAPTPPPRVVTPPAPAPAPKAETPHAIPPATLKSLLATSNKIDVPELVQTQMKRDEKKKANAVIKVCIGTGGEVTTTSVIKSSGYSAYDDNLVAGIRSWRYRPYMADGRAVPACSAVAISFAIQ
jgi:protein TonB